MSPIPFRRLVPWHASFHRVCALAAMQVAVEQVIGVGAAVTGDMLSRPNFGLNELDFVFSTLIVGSLMNFSLMYLLAPTAGVPPSTVTPALSTWPSPSHGSPVTLSRVSMVFS